MKTKKIEKIVVEPLYAEQHDIPYLDYESVSKQEIVDKINEIIDYLTPLSNKSKKLTKK